MKRISVGLTTRASATHAPLAAFGYALRRANVLKPLTSVALPIKTFDYEPADKVLEALVLILAGGRATYQIDLLLRPNCTLAQAWGQPQFAQQATVARTLDAFGDERVAQLRDAFELILQTHSHVRRHDFRKGELWLDGDLVGLPASRRAIGSTKGYFAGEKTVSGVN